MRLPWKRETRDDGGTYTDTLVDLMVSEANGAVISRAVAVREVAAGLWGRAFASAQVEPNTTLTSALTPSVLARIGRAMIDPGEAVFVLDVDGPQPVLLEASSWTITGGNVWQYQCDVLCPSQTVTRKVVSDGVIHVRYSSDASRPWVGLGPLQWCKETLDAAAVLETRLNQELGGAVGNLLPVPDAKKSSQLQTDLNNLKGRTALVTSAASWDGAAGNQTTAQGDFSPRRIGGNPPPTIEPLRDALSRSILAACGVPAALLGLSDGTALRESYRQFVFAGVGPVALLVQEELSAKLDDEITLSFDRLMASDLSGRARAFQSMVKGGLDVAKAAALAGLMESES